MAQNSTIRSGGQPAKDSRSSENPFEVEIYFDGRCSLCAKEIGWLQRLDRRRRVRFTDIAAEDFDPLPTGQSLDALMRRIHGRLPDGTPLEGVEVFRRVYAAVGFRCLVPLTRLPLVRSLLDAGYRAFARWRYRRRCRSGYCPVSPPGRSPRI